MGTTGGASDGVSATGATDYCTSAEIALFLWANSGADFSDSTTPTKVAVEAAIIRVEDIIDTATKHAWRKASITNEYHDYVVSSIHRRPFGWARGRQPNRGVYLTHRAIRAFVSGTNKIEIWDGDEWIDLILDANGYTEGRDEDYWIDYENGVIYFSNEAPIIGQKTVRVTYDYGETSVPKDIKEWCIKQTAIDLLYSDDRSVFVIEGTDNVGLDPKIRAWKEDIKEISTERRETLFA